MITRIQALGFRSLQHVDVELGRFQVLVGPNGSGKSAFLNVVSFVSELASNREGLEGAIHSQAESFQDLTWMQTGKPFEIVLELALPDYVKRRHKQLQAAGLRYELRIGSRPDSTLAVQHEVLYLLPEGFNSRPAHVQKKLFPEDPAVPRTLMLPENISKRLRTIVRLKPETGNVYFGYEQTDKGGTTSSGLTIRFLPRRSALAVLPDEVERMPAALWFRDLLFQGVQRLSLSGEKLRSPAPPGASRRFESDGSNLPTVINDFRETGQPFRDWIEHVRTAIPDLRDVQTIERPEDKKRYLVLDYESGLSAPSWVASDGTLRLLALTLIAYLPDRSVLYLIEEPENGIHPRAIETLFQSLASAYNSQVFVATHSPVVLAAAEKAQVLCFARTKAGATDIVRGDRHPRLAHWKGEANLGWLHASGVLD